MTRSLPHILLLNHTARLGGAELALLRLVDELQERKQPLQLTAVVMEEGRLVDELSSRGLEVTVVPLPAYAAAASRHSIRHPSTLITAALGGARFLGSLRRLLRSQKPDIVQSGSMKAHLLGVVATAGRSEKLVWYMHDLVAPPYVAPSVGLAIRWMSRFPAAVFVNSRATSKTVPRSTVLAYPGYSEFQKLDSKDTRTRSQRAAGPFVLLGRISPTKGQLEFVKAAALVRETHPKARFVIAGSPMFGEETYAQSVVRTIDQMGLTEFVTLLGFVHDPFALLDDAVALVHASPVPEPFGQVILEAAIRGVPVVATRAGGAPEILTDDEGEEHGLLVPPGDVAGLAAAMIEVLHDPQASASRAEKARAYTVRNFPIVSTVQTVVETWERLLTSQART